jgi:tetratricopeptide (TPR) repeat protein
MQEEEPRLVTIDRMETRIPDNLYYNLEDIIRREVLKTDNPEEIMAPYEFPFENLQQIAQTATDEYRESIRNMADDIWSKEDWLDSLIVYYILMHITKFIPTDFYKFGYILAKIGEVEFAQEIIQIYEKVSTNKKITYHAIANFYYSALDIPEKGIEYFEKYIELDDTNPLVYNSLGHLYSKIGNIQKQFDSFKKAYNLKPDEPTFVKSLLTVYEKMHDTEKIKEFYPKLIQIAPSPRHSLNYGLYLFGWGEIQKGYKYFSERFDLDGYPIGYPKDILPLSTKWNYKDDISGKTLVVHYEEGFGDSIMFARFLPILKQFASKTVLIVQPSLVDLFKQSKIISDGIEIFGDIKEFLAKYPNVKFTHMPLMDTPYPIGVDSHFIPYPDKYLSSEVEDIKSDKFKIGIAYNGDVSANYNGRDVQLKEFYNLAKISGVQLYSLQVGESSHQLQNLPSDVSIIDLGKTFTDFKSSAKAIYGMDLIVSTDNVILNLAGALGKNTLGIFNKYPNFRWFDLNGKNTVWYDSVRPVQCEVENDWKSAMNKVEEIITSEFLNG